MSLPGILKAALVMRWGQLHDHLRDAVLHLRERHGIDDLIADAIEILPAKVGLAPQVVKVDGVQGLGDLLGVETLGFLHPSNEREGGVGKVDTGGVPGTVFLGIALLPALERLWEWLLDIAMHPHAFDVLLPSNTSHYRGVNLPNMDETPLKPQLARLLNNQANTPRWGRV